jgi:hypothetical protein
VNKEQGNSEILEMWEEKGMEGHRRVTVGKNKWENSELGKPNGGIF